MSPYFILWNECIWVQNPAKYLFFSILMRFWCLNICKWGQNINFWNFQENWTLHFRKNWRFMSKLSARALFKILPKFSSNFYFEVSSAKDNIKTDRLTKFEYSIMFTLSVVPVWMYFQRSYSNALGSTHFSPIEFNVSITVDVLGTVANKPLRVKAWNSLSRSTTMLSLHM